MSLRNKILLAAVCAAGVLSGCSREPAPKVDDGAAAAKAAYEKSILAWRAERVDRLLKPAGWLSLVGMHWLEQGSTHVGSNPKFTTRLAVGPSDLGMLTLGKDKKITFVAEPDAGVTIDGQPATGTATLLPDTNEAGPTVVGFNKDDASFIVIERGGRFALRVRDALASTRTAFPGIAYFDIDPSFRVQARFTPHAKGQTMDIVNILGMVEPMNNPGTLTFDKDGKQFTIEALDDTGDGQLFVVFADGTSGHESYAAARFLYTDPPGPDGTVVLDFNKAYNPPCAFTSFSTCPMPPPSNRLPFKVTAGERKPRKIEPVAAAAQ